MIPEKEILVLIPAFNEEGRIGEVIRGVRQFLPGTSVLVVNDGSSDRTEDISRREGALVVTHPFNLGVGSALQTGYKFAVQNGYKYVVQLDGDGQHDPSDLPRFLRALEETEADLVIGSRYLSDGYQSISFPRRLGIWVFSRLLSILIRERLTDPTSGYRAMTRRVLQFCTLDAYRFDYPDADFLLTLHRAGFRMAEIQIDVRPRLGGQSQHRGLRPVYYMLKMFLSIFIILLRKKSVYKQ
jgi:hypothetical protein